MVRDIHYRLLPETLSAEGIPFDRALWHDGVRIYEAEGGSAVLEYAKRYVNELETSFVGLSEGVAVLYLVVLALECSPDASEEVLEGSNLMEMVKEVVPGFEMHRLCLGETICDP